MEASKLSSIIQEQNRRRERNAFSEAENLIEEIAALQLAITHTQEKIGRLRKQLTELQVEQLDESTILGGS